MMFNVRFTIQTERLHALHQAVSEAQLTLHKKADSSWMRSVLFPEEEDGYYQKTLNKLTSDLDFRDPLLNYEQSRAVHTVVKENYGPVPFIVSGPPGTGKTKTIVELALQLIAIKKSSHLLVCAPSDPAADTLVQRLKLHFGPRDLLRVNSPSRSFPEVPDSVLPFCCVDDGMFSLPSFGELMRCRTVVTTCRDAKIMLQARVSNRDLFHLERNMYRAIHPEADEVIPKLHWTALLVDEAAQATEPESLIPLNVVAPPSEGNVREDDWPLFVMAGDQHQLGPRTASKLPEVRTSLFERLLERRFYRDHPLARSKGYGGIVRPLTQDVLPILRPAFMSLIRNYRSHPTILATPSALFYYDTLEPEATDSNALLSWARWKGRKWPVLFSCNKALDEIEKEDGGWFNMQEARIACHHAQSFVQTGLLRPEDICIMSPFQAQVRVIRRLASQTFGMPGLNIGPLEAFQGLESRLVILCTTRTRDRFIENDIAKGLGVIHEPKRFNVALTRAKQGLIVIGNPAVLEKDSDWRAFLGFCQRNRLYENAQSLLPDAKHTELGSKSRLEKQMVHQQESPNDQSLVINGVRKLRFTGDAEDDFWTAGLAAEEAVRSGEDDWIEE
jgi:helicase MOV-10